MMSRARTAWTLPKTPPGGPGAADRAPGPKGGSAGVRIHQMVVRPFLLLIDLYRILVSPLLPPSCRFQPTCSEYAREALLRHGLWRGGRLAIWRILRCHPFRTGGWDPVP